jgi:hypothetical protein
VRARTLQLMSKKVTILLEAYKREARKLADELKRLDSRIAQIDDLNKSYREHLALPQLRAAEYRDAASILMRLTERREIDVQRQTLLTVERDRLGRILAEKKRQIERLDEEAKRVVALERLEKERIREMLTPAPRK